MDCKGFTAVMIVLLLAGASHGADFLYTPQPAAAAPADTEGILVREVTVKRGDTLSHLAKQYTGRGHYYPQILLFNTIKNPHRIYPGQVVRMPLAHKAAAAVQSPAAAAEQTIETVPAAVAEQTVKKSKRSSKKSDDRSHRTTPATAAERAAYNAAQAAFARGDCNRAIALFDRFIARYPSSARIAEATLNRAECYLKLSGN